jgi:hypothetical protein
MMRPPRLSAWLLLLCLGLGATRETQAFAQADVAPVAPRDVADFLIRVLTAPLVTVETLLRSSPAELPWFRLRLYVGETVAGESWVGVDYNSFRAAGKPQRVELALPAAPFRDRLTALLRDPATALQTPSEAGVRVVDVWCRHAGPTGRPLPLMAKVWRDVSAAGIPGTDAAGAPSGRVCHDDLPALVECARVLDFAPLLAEQDIQPASAAGDAADILSLAITTHRAEVAAFIANPLANSGDASLIPGGATIVVTDPRGLPSARCTHEGTVARTLATGESFIGLAADARKGTVSLELELPFSAGGGAVWAPTSMATDAGTIEVEASTDGTTWTRLFRLDSSTLRDDGPHVLPASLLGGSTLTIRARLTAREDAAAASRESGLRFLHMAPPLPCRYQIACDADVMRVIARPEATAICLPALRIVSQPESLAPDEVAALVQAGGSEIDVYAACELDESTCREIGNHDGTIRFWSSSTWQTTPPPWLATIASGPGRLEFLGFKTPSVPLVTALTAGTKSLSFPRVDNPSGEVLAGLARCSGELSLDGVPTLAPEQAEAFGHYRGPKLSLAGLRMATITQRPSVALLRAAVAAPGSVSLPGLTELDAATATVLASGQKHLQLDAVASLTPEITAILSRMPRGLSLDGVKTLDKAAAAALLPYAGAHLSLAGLRVVECGISDLPSANVRRQPNLWSLVLAPPTAAEAAAMERNASLEELEAIFRDAVAKGIEKEADREHFFENALRSDVPLATTLARLRGETSPSKPSSRVRIAGTSGTSLEAFVRTPGVFRLQPRVGLAVGKGEFDTTVAKTLARGRKDLDLDCLAALDADVAAALADSGTVVSLDGLRAITGELATPLIRYQGPLLSLQGIETIDDGVATLFEPLVKADRSCLPAAGMFNIAGLRTFVADTAQQKQFSSFWNLSKSREWSGQERIAKGRARVVLLLRNEVVFGNEDRESRIARDKLSASSRNSLTTLADNAATVVAARKDHLLAAAATGESRTATPPSRD